MFPHTKQLPQIFLFLHLAVNCTWYTEADCLGIDYVPIIIELTENIKEDESENENKIPKFQYKHDGWQAYQASLLSSDIYSRVNEDELLKL